MQVNSYCFYCTFNCFDALYQASLIFRHLFLTCLFHNLILNICTLVPVETTVVALTLTSIYAPVENEPYVGFVSEPGVCVYSFALLLRRRWIIKEKLCLFWLHAS